MNLFIRQGVYPSVPEPKLQEAQSTPTFPMEELEGLGFSIQSNYLHLSNADQINLKLHYLSHLD